MVHEKVDCGLFCTICTFCDFLRKILINSLSDHHQILLLRLAEFKANLLTSIALKGNRGELLFPSRETEVN